MSGGYFDYAQFHITKIVDDIEHVLDTRSDDYPSEVLQRFREAVVVLRRAESYAHRIDWLLSGDDSEKSFLERLREDLEEVEAK